MTKSEKNILVLGGITIAILLAKKGGDKGGDAVPEIVPPFGGNNASGLPKGIANKNPLNLALSANKWQGKIPNEQNTDTGTPRLEQFTDTALGIRANLLNLNAYMKEYFDANKKSIPLKEAISNWGSGKLGQYGTNATITNYVNYVVKRMNESGNLSAKVTPDDLLNTWQYVTAVSDGKKAPNPNYYWALFRGMAEFENGTKWAKEINDFAPEFKRAWEMLSKSVPFTMLKFNF